MKKEYTIEVSATNIKNGVEKDVCLCPIALACKKKFHTNNVRVVEGFESNVVKINCVSYRLPKKALKFIENFDEEKKVKPIKFKIKALD